MESLYLLVRLLQNCNKEKLASVYLAENNGSSPPGGWLQVTCGLTACTLGSAPSNEYGRTCTFYFFSTIVGVALQLVKDATHNLAPETPMFCHI